MPIVTKQQIEKENDPYSKYVEYYVIEDQIKRLIKNIEQNPKDAKKNDQLAKYLQSILQKELPGCYIEPFGSATTELALKNSNIDLFLRLDHDNIQHLLTEQSENDVYENVHNNIITCLHQYEFKNIFGYPKSRILLVNFTQIATNINCNLSLRYDFGVRNSQLLKMLIKKDDRIRQIILFFKYWAKTYNIIKDFSFSSYAISMLVIYFMQSISPPILPTIESLQRGESYEKIMIDGWDCGFDIDKLKSYKSLNDDKILILLEGVFRMCSELPFERNIISTYTGKMYNKELFNKTEDFPEAFCNYADYIPVGVYAYSPICILDPFVHSRNITCNVTQDELEYFKTQCSLAADHLESLPKIDLLEKILGKNASLPCKGIVLSKKEKKNAGKNVNQPQKSAVVGENMNKLDNLTCEAPIKKIKRKRLRNKKQLQNSTAIENNMDILNILEAKLNLLITQIEQSTETFKKVDTIIDNLQFMLNALGLSGCTVKVSNFATTELALKDSNIDIFSYLHLQTDKSTRVFYEKSAPMIKNCLLNSQFSNVVFHPKARVPFFNFTETCSGLKCNLYLGYDFEVHSSKLLSMLIKTDNRIRPIIMFIKYWAKTHKIIKESSFTDYAITMLVIYYLQTITPPIFPTIQSLQYGEDYEKIMIDGWNCGFDIDKLMLNKNENHDNIIALLGAFFRMCSKLDFNEYIISVYTGDKYSKQLFKSVEDYPAAFHNHANRIKFSANENSSICIVDPFVHSHNITYDVSQDELKYFKAQCTSAADHLESLHEVDSIRKILCTNVSLSCKDKTLDKEIKNGNSGNENQQQNSSVVDSGEKMDVLSNLEDQVRLLIELEHNPNAFKSALMIVHNLQCIFNEIQLPGCAVQLFGSVTTELMLKDSNVDLLLHLDHLLIDQSKNAFYKAICPIIDKCLSCCQFSNIVFHPKTWMPFFNFTETSSGLNCNLYIGYEFGVHNSKFLSMLIKTDIRIRPIIMFIKHWAKTREIIKESSFTGYAITMLVIYYLQTITHPILPTIQSLQYGEDYEKIMVDDWNFGFDTDKLMLNKNENHDNIITLLGAFFRMCSKLDFNEYIISVYTGDKYSIQLFKSVEDYPAAFHNHANRIKFSMNENSSICIVDPFVHSHNITYDVSQDELEYFKAQCTFAADHLESLLEVDSIKKILYTNVSPLCNDQSPFKIIKQRCKRNAKHLQNSTVVVSDSEEKRDVSYKFEDQLNLLIIQVEQSPESFKSINTIVHNLQFMLNKLELPGCSVKAFGSVSTELALKDSNVDLFLYLKTEKSEDAFYEEISPIIEYCLLNCQFSNIIFQPKARVSFYNFTETCSGLNCKLYLRDDSGVHNSKLLSLLVKTDSRIRPIIMFIKYWAKTREIINESSFTSYAITMLVIYYLQTITPPILPTIQSLQSGEEYEKIIIDDWNCGFAINKSNTNNNCDDIITLLRGFFQMCTKLNFNEDIISIYTGAKYIKKMFKKVENLPPAFLNHADRIKIGVDISKSIIILDPFVHSHNITQNVKPIELRHFKTQCKIAANDMLMVGRENEDLIEHVLGIKVSLPQGILQSKSNMIYVSKTELESDKLNYIEQLKLHIEDILNRYLRCDFKVIEKSCNNVTDGKVCTLTYNCLVFYKMWENRHMYLHDKIKDLMLKEEICTDLLIRNIYKDTKPEKFEFEFNIKFQVHEQFLIYDIECLQLNSAFYKFNYDFKDKLEFLLTYVSKPNCEKDCKVVNDDYINYFLHSPFLPLYILIICTIGFAFFFLTFIYLVNSYPLYILLICIISILSFFKCL